MLETSQIHARRALSEVGTEVQVPKKTLLDGKDVYYLQSGYCSLTNFTKEGKRHTYIIFKPGVLFNFIPTVRKSIYTTSDYHFNALWYPDLSIYTCSKCSLLSIEGDTLLKLVKENDDVAKLFLHSYTENIAKLLASANAMATSSAVARVAIAILDGIPSEPPYILPSIYTYSEISAYISLHTVTIAKIFKAFLEHNIIAKDGNTKIVVDYKALEDIAKEKREIYY